jgi:hypothetical protein
MDHKATGYECLDWISGVRFVNAVIDKIQAEKGDKFTDKLRDY